MPFRDRMRKAFGRPPAGTTPSPAAAAAASLPKRTKSQRANVYRIGEPMPQPKYPAKYDKPHQDMLRAFSFASITGRRKSDQTDVSPMGSRWASRKNSEVEARRSLSHKPSDIAENPEMMDVDMVDDSSEPASELDRKHHERGPELELPLTSMTNGSAHYDGHDLSAALQRTTLSTPAVNATA